MSDNSSIEWTESTWNPIIGCTKVSSGCDNCYPIPLARIRERNPNRKVADAFAGVVERTENGLDWTGKVNLLPERLEQPLKWRKPRRIFVNSLSDLFHEAVPDEFIARVFAVMAACPQHTFQVLTKRHARMRSLLNNTSWRSAVYLRESVTDLAGPPRDIPSWPLPNVHLGVSVEDQRWADIRIPALLETPAAVRWISAEPLLGPVDLGPYLTGDCPTCGDDITEDACGGLHARMQLDNTAAGLAWVVTGGESGPKARPMHPDWARSLRDQCTEAGVPFFFKQWGEWSPVRPIGHYGEQPARRKPSVKFAPDGTVYDPFQPDLLHHPGMKTVYRVGKKSAGRELDGRTWDEFPRAAAEVSA